VDHQAVDDLHRALLKVLVRAVDGVARLEADDGVPVVPFKQRARFGGRKAVLAKAAVGDGPRQRHRPAEQDVAHVERGRDARVRLVVGFEDRDASFPLVVGILLLDGHNRQNVARGVRQRCVFAEGEAVGDFRLDAERDGYGPGKAVGQVHVADDGPVIRAAHEALQRAQAAVADHLQVGSGAVVDGDFFEGRGARQQLVGSLGRRDAVYQLAAVGGDTHRDLSCLRRGKNV